MTVGRKKAVATPIVSRSSEASEACFAYLVPQIVMSVIGDAE